MKHKIGAHGYGQYGLIGFLKAADFNSTADQEIKMVSARYRLDAIFTDQPSTSLSLAAGGIYDAASKGGNPIVAAAQVYAPLTAAGKSLALTLEAITATDTLTAASLYLSLTTAQGGAATANLYLYGYSFDPNH